MSKKLVKDSKNEITIDFSNHAALLQVMNTYGSDKQGEVLDIFGLSSNRESMVISIYSDKIITKTYQRNGWIRQNTYHRDGQIEELFSEKWEPEVTHSSDDEIANEDKVEDKTE